MQASPIARINLESLSAVLVEQSPHSLDLLTQIVASFGLRSVQRFESGAEAQRYLGQSPTDLLLTEVPIGEPDGYDLIHWLRRDSLPANRFIPVVLVTGHTRHSQILRARDCGASYTVAKPVSPKVLMERIFWASSDQRMFIDTDTFIGPDRRFKNIGPPKDCDGRRQDDLKGELGRATTPNLDQNEIDQLVKPQKASL
jgi:CheY-like chemotaxis protein